MSWSMNKTVINLLLPLNTNAETCVSGIVAVRLFSQLVIVTGVHLAAVQRDSSRTPPHATYMMEYRCSSVPVSVDGGGNPLRPSSNFSNSGDGSLAALPSW